MKYVFYECVQINEINEPTFSRDSRISFDVSFFYRSNENSTI